MSAGFERDIAKMERVERMRCRASRLWWAFMRGAKDRRKLKRVQALEARANRILTVRNARFLALRARGLWPRP